MKNIYLFIDASQINLFFDLPLQLIIRTDAQWFNFDEECGAPNASSLVDFHHPTTNDSVLFFIRFRLQNRSESESDLIALEIEIWFIRKTSLSRVYDQNSSVELSFIELFTVDP